MTVEDKNNRLFFLICVRVKLLLMGGRYDNFTSVQLFKLEDELSYKARNHPILDIISIISIHK